MYVVDFLIHHCDHSAIYMHPVVLNTSHATKAEYFKLLHVLKDLNSKAINKYCQSTE